MGFNWDDEDEGEFRDMPEGVFNNNPPIGTITGAAQMSNQQPQRPPPQQQNLPVPVAQVIEEYIEAEEAEEEDFEAVLADANLRIDLASLYKLIMNHDLFEGMDVDQRAIDTVHKEVRRFARERMEIMLGMRQEAQKEAMVSSPFNDLEVDVLKKLASAATKGASSSPEANKTAQVLKQPRREGLNTIGGGAPKLAPQPRKPLASKQQAPIQRPTKPQAPIVNEEEYKPLAKPPQEMTEQERIERNKEASARQAARKSVKSSTALPMPTADQEEMYHTQRVMTSDHPLANQGAVSAILTALNKSKNQ